MVLGRPITLQDMQSVDVELYNSVQYVLENDPEPLCLSFAVNKTVLGEVHTYCCDSHVVTVLLPFSSRKKS